MHQSFPVNGFLEICCYSSCTSQDSPWVTNAVSRTDVWLRRRDNTAVKLRILPSSENFSHFFSISQIFPWSPQCGWDGEMKAHEFAYHRKRLCLSGGKLICLDTRKTLWVSCIKKAFYVLYSPLRWFNWFNLNIVAELLCLCQCEISKPTARRYEQFIAVSFHKSMPFLWLFFLKKIKLQLCQQLLLTFSPVLWFLFPIYDSL